MRRCRRAWVTGVLALMAVVCSVAVAAAAETKVRVNVFPGIQDLPMYAAQVQGFFAKRGLSVDVEFTPNSQAQRDGLAQGRFEIAHAAIDNAVAMVDVAKVDVIIILGGSNGLNSLIVQPEIRSVADLKGKMVIVDAPNTAYALLLYKVLQLNGLKKGEYTVKPLGASFQRLEALRKDKSYAASMLNPPFSIQAEKDGLRNLGPAVRWIGTYQGPGAFVMRSWAQANPDTLVRYIQAIVEGHRWAMNPVNKAAVVALLGERLKLAPDVAENTYEAAADPVGGFAKDARFDIEGFKNTLKLRAELEGPSGASPPAPEKYYDFSYYERALGGL